MFLVKDKFVICNMYDKCHAYCVHIDLLCIYKDLLEENKYNTIHEWHAGGVCIVIGTVVSQLHSNYQG